MSNTMILFAALAIIVFFSFTAVILYLLMSRKNNNLEGLETTLKDLKEEIRVSRDKSFESLHVQLQESGKIVRDVTAELQKIHSDHQNVIDVKTQLEKLSDILANPKQRGILGEYFLETLLKNVFQPSQYKLQYQFRDGEIVDAVIFIKDKIIPIDSKFSLDNYNRIVEEKNSVEREKLEKLFKQDLKTRIDETSKYIRPEEGTMDFAFMFIPSEGIYYDLLINQVGAIKVNTRDLIDYAVKEKRVHIVSPNTFYAYLITILEGLRAFQIEESTKEIRVRVAELGKHLVAFSAFLQKLGNYLTTTVNSYNQTYKELAKIDKDVVKITGKEKEIEPLELEKPTHAE